MILLGAHHLQALHQHGPILGCQFVPVPLACVGDETAHLGVVLGLPVLVSLPGRAMSVRLPAVWNLPVLEGPARDQAAGRRLLVQHLRPTPVGNDPLDEVLAEGHVVEPALFLQGQQREAVHHFSWEHARAVPLCYSVLACTCAQARAL
jgi:hypothetical protein